MENELTEGDCREIIFIFARGTFETGNMSLIVDPQVCSGLKSKYGDAQVACQGVGPPSNATLEDNFLPQTTSPEDIAAATTLFDLAYSKCPSSIVVAGGYSQGSVVMDGSIQALPSAEMNQIAGVVLFGFSRNKQDNGRIPNYPPEDTKVYCAQWDVICHGTLLITITHLGYGSDAPDAVDFFWRRRSTCSLDWIGGA